MTGEFRWPLSGLLIGSLALSGLTFASASSAAVVDVVGGHLSIVYDGAVFANPSNSSFGLVAADGDFMRYGRFWSAAETVGSAPFYFARQPAEFRPLAATVRDTLPWWNEVVPAQRRADANVATAAGHFAIVPEQEAAALAAWKARR